MTTNLPATALSAITADVNVGMNEVVSVFVARFETTLLAKKAELAATIKLAKSELTDLEHKLIASVDKTKFEGAIPGAGIRAVVESVTVAWEKQYYSPANSIVVNINIVDSKNNDDDDDDKTLTSFRRNFKIDKAIVDERASIENKIKDLNAELLGILDQLKSVGRKERQIRGRIAEMKLESSGLSELVNNPELLKLVDM